jgi:hypothetical protein
MERVVARQGAEALRRRLSSDELGRVSGATCWICPAYLTEVPGGESRQDGPYLDCE